MRNQFFKCLIFSAVLLTVVTAADAQRRGRTTRGNTARPDTTRPQQQNVQQNTNPASVQSYNPYGNVPIEMAPQIGGFNDTIVRIHSEMMVLLKEVCSRNVFPLIMNI